MSSIKIIYFLSILTLSLASFFDSIKTLSSINEFNSSSHITYTDNNNLETELVDE